MVIENLKEKKSYRILIIDDNKSIHDDYRKVLSFENHAGNALVELSNLMFGSEKDAVYMPEFIIDSAYQGQQGIAAVEKSLKHKNPYAIAFVDIRIPPGLDGIETIKALWSHDPNVQIVVCTAYSDYSFTDIVKHLKRTNHFLIIKKPFDNIVLRQFACALVSKWDTMKQLTEEFNNLQKLVDIRTQELKKAVSLLRSTLESTADGILVVDLQSNIVDWNQRFIELWRIPETILSSRSDNDALKFVLNQLKDPDAFLQRIKELMQNPDEESIDMLGFKDGRVFERHSRPQRMENTIIGRVWSFRDITEHKRLEEKLNDQ